MTHALSKNSANEGTRQTDVVETMTDAEEQSRNFEKDWTRRFEAMLAEVKYDYQKNLLEVDLLDQDKLEKVLTAFNERIVLCQHKFMEHLSMARGGVDNPHIKKIVVEVPPLDQTPKIVAWIIGGSPVATGIYGALRMSRKKLLKFVHKHPAVIIGGLVVVAGAYGVSHMWSKKQLKLIRKHLIDQFDEKIAPTLRDWAHDKIVAE